MKGSVKIMLSYDYSHFEVCLGSDEDMSIKQVNELRKQAQRLADEAVRQYHMAKEMAMLRLDILSGIKTFLEEIRIIRQKPQSEWTATDQAKIKALADETYWSRGIYDYEDEDDEIPF